jgi:hypothetical protein
MEYWNTSETIIRYLPKKLHANHLNISALLSYSGWVLARQKITQDLVKNLNRFCT